MNKLKFLAGVLCMTVLLSSCSKDDPEPVNNNPTIGLFTDGQAVVNIPQGLLESEDEYAIMASSFVSASTSFAAYGSFFNIPQGAAKTSEPIEASNGRLAAGGYSVYTWSDGNGNSIAYQFSETEDMQKIEIFFKESGSDYLKMLEVSQQKDGKKGQMTWYDTHGPAMVWTWEKDGMGNYFLTFNDGYNRYEIFSNTDKSGSIKFYTSDVLEMEMSWDSLGNGSWKSYSDGAVDAQGEWFV